VVNGSFHKGANSVATKTLFSLSAGVRFLRRYGFRLFRSKKMGRSLKPLRAALNGAKGQLLFNGELASPTEAERTPKEREATYASMRGWRGPRKPGSTYADPTKIDAARAMLAGGTGILKCQDCRAWHRHGASV